MRNSTRTNPQSTGCTAHKPVFSSKLALAALVVFLSSLIASAAAPGASYTNYVMENVPWSIHVVTLDRSDPALEIHSVHAHRHAIGLATLSSQIALVTNLGVPIAALNGDFYQRENTFAGDPRGLQIINGELISGPVGGAAFWVSETGEPHCDTVDSRFTVTFPDGSSKPFVLNAAMPHDSIALYTPTLGESTHSTKSREFVLEKQEGSAWLPLKLQCGYTARIREVHETGNTPLTSNTMVLSIGPAMAKTLPVIAQGDAIKLSTTSLPGLTNTKAAIGGGPTLVHNHKKLKFNAGSSGSFAVSSMAERHPRSAIGWNQKTIFLIEVDGRQKDLSVGMTLDELATFALKIGCDEAMNLDGGGSSSVWFDGSIRNNPCDGKDRFIANTLVVLRKFESKTEILAR